MAPKKKTNKSKLANSSQKGKSKNAKANNNSKVKENMPVSKISVESDSDEVLEFSDAEDSDSSELREEVDSFIKSLNFEKYLNSDLHKEEKEDNAMKLTVESSSSSSGKVKNKDSLDANKKKEKRLKHNSENNPREQSKKTLEEPSKKLKKCLENKTDKIKKIKENCLNTSSLELVTKPLTHLKQENKLKKNNQKRDKSSGSNDEWAISKLKKSKYSAESHQDEDNKNNDNKSKRKLNDNSNSEMKGRKKEKLKDREQMKESWSSRKKMKESCSSSQVSPSGNLNLSTIHKPQSKFDKLELKMILGSDANLNSTGEFGKKKQNRIIGSDIEQSTFNESSDSKLEEIKNLLNKAKAKSNTSQIRNPKIEIKKDGLMKNVNKFQINPEKSEINSQTISSENTEIDQKNNLKEKLKKHLQSASFRIINEKLYKSSGSDAYKMFTENPDSFKVYHEGYNSQVLRWPVKPLQMIIAWIRKKPRNWVLADFGCGDATLARSVCQKVHSLDLVASAPNVIECDMAHTPLQPSSINVVIFCLSLMGTNLQEFILEANRVLVDRGILKIAEVESRFDKNLTEFLSSMAKLGFKCIHKDQKQNYFWLFDFIKIKNVKKSNLMNVSKLKLKPCIYKRR